MEFGGAPVVSLPANELALYRDAIAEWRAGVVLTSALIQAVFGERVAAILGPAFVGYTDSEWFPPVPSGKARPLIPGDRKAFDMLRTACSVQEWESGGNDFRPSSMIGVFESGGLAALASYELWGARIAHISIVSHPLLRGRGYAATAVSALIKIVLERGLVPQYRTLETNKPSMAVARGLGFVQYATSFAVRLSSLKPSQP
jgi:GNAT superfamily N-acetyltransferase